MAVQDFLHDKTFPLAERLKLIREIHHAIGIKLSNCLDEWLVICAFDREMLRSARCWAFLLIWDRRALEKFHAELIEEVVKEDEKTPKPLKPLIESLLAVPDLIHSFVAERPEGNDVDAARETWGTVAHDRDNGVCILTGASACNASYVIPPRADNEAAVPWDSLFNLTPQLGPEASTRLTEKLEPEDGLTYTAANAITLSEPLKHMWERGMFALEPVGYETRTKASGNAARRTSAHQDAAVRQTTSTQTPPAASVTWTRDLVVQPSRSTSADHGQEPKMEATQTGLKLRFHWLRKTNLIGLNDDPPNLDSDPRLLFQEWEHTGDEPVPMRVFGSGDTFTIWAEDHDDLPDWDFLQLRFFAMRLYCLTGAADPDLYIPPLAYIHVFHDGSSAAMRQASEMLRDRMDNAKERANKKIDQRRLAEYGDVLRPEYKTLAQNIITEHTDNSISSI